MIHLPGYTFSVFNLILLLLTINEAMLFIRDYYMYIEIRQPIVETNLVFLYGWLLNTFKFRNMVATV